VFCKCLVQTDCVRICALIQLGEGGSGEVRADLLSYVELDLWLGACKNIGRD
jgi:hypothetical protein